MWRIKTDPKSIIALADILKTSLTAAGTIGIGSGSKVLQMMPDLATHLPENIAFMPIDPNVAQSMSMARLNLRSFELNVPLDWAIIEAREADDHGNFTIQSYQSIARDKLMAVAARRCCLIAPTAERVVILGVRQPVVVEVLPFARHMVCRRAAAMGSLPVSIPGGRSIDGMELLELHGLDLADAATVERHLQAIPGVVAVGLAAACRVEIITDTCVVEM